MHSGPFHTRIPGILILCALFGCSDLEYNEPPGQPNRGMPDQELFGATIRFSQAGKTRFTVTANRLRRFEANDYMKMDNGVKADLYNKQNRHIATLTSREADVIESREELIARGNVVVKSDSGHMLYADTLYYDPELSRIKSDGFVTMVSPTDSLSGFGFSASPNLDDWEIKNSSGATWREIQPPRRSKTRTHR